MSDAEKQQYLKFAKALAYEAGEIMRKYFLATKTEWKSDNTPLTQADTEINRLVIERIAAEFPEHSVLGEEESAIRGGEFVWVCDPVDGTMPYSHSLPISTFSLALCEDGIPQVGVVYDPFMDRLFYATMGGSAFCNGEKIQVNNQDIKNALIDAEVGQIVHQADKHTAASIGSRMLENLEEKDAKLVGLWSCILPTCLVAAGLFTAVILNGTKAHDIAASKLIVEEAGGKVTDLFGNDQRYDGPTKGFIASNGVIHDQLVRMVREASEQ